MVADQKNADDVPHRWREFGNRRGRNDNQDSKSDDRQRHIDGGSRGQELLGKDEDSDHGQPRGAHDAQRHLHQHQSDARAHAV